MLLKFLKSDILVAICALLCLASTIVHVLNKFIPRYAEFAIHTGLRTCYTELSMLFYKLLFARKIIAILTFHL